MVRNYKDRSAGFTIVELMIATAVFSLVLLVVTTGFLAFTRSYFRGVNTAATQSAARNITDVISQSVQFELDSADLSRIENGVFCLGSRRFSYVPGQKYDGTATTTGLVSRPFNGGSCQDSPATDSDTSDTVQLLGKNMRVASIKIAPDPNGETFSVETIIAYGDADLLCSDAVDCRGSDEITNWADQSAGLRCRAVSGSQFCSVSALKTVVTKRVSGS